MPFFSLVDDAHILDFDDEFAEIRTAEQHFQPFRRLREPGEKLRLFFCNMR